MTDSNNPQAPRRPSSNSPTAWVVGVIFIIAVLATALFYNGWEPKGSRTTADPATAPNVVTGNDGSRK